MLTDHKTLNNNVYIKVDFYEQEWLVYYKVNEKPFLETNLSSSISIFHTFSVLSLWDTMVILTVCSMAIAVK